MDDRRKAKGPQDLIRAEQHERPAQRWAAWCSPEGDEAFPFETRRGKRGQASWNGRKRNAATSGAGGDGKAVFEQLRQYLSTKAPKEYVGQTVLRLSKGAADRRFQAHLQLLPVITKNMKEAGALRREWTDAIPYRLKEQYEGLLSDWDLSKPEHQERLNDLMYKWIIIEKAPLRAIEDRVRFFRFTVPEEADRSDEASAQGTYLEAVTPAGNVRRPSLTAEQARLRDLCMQAVTPITKLRARTAEETAAILMIINHEIEVPRVPPFLSHSMSPRELAIFEDIFMGLDYPLYAHVAPGQRFFTNTTKSAILAQINCGPEAAPAHKLKIPGFKNELSRISLDMQTRVLKVTFKGRSAASKWVGWNMPLASRLLLLIDYERIRERSKRTHEVVMLDYYSFEVWGA